MMWEVPKMNKKSTKIVPKIFQHGSQNPPKLFQKSSKMAPKIYQNCSKIISWGGLGGGLVKSCFLTPRFPSFFCLREVSWSELGPKLAPSWPKLGASSAKLGPRCAMLAPSWPMLGPSWANLGQLGLQSWIFEAFWSIFKGCSNLYRFFNPFWIDFSWFFDASKL